MRITESNRPIVAEPSRKRRAPVWLERALTLLLVATSLISVVTCAGRGAIAPQPESQPGQGPSSGTETPALSSDAATLEALDPHAVLEEAPADQAEAPAGPSSPIAPFFDALSDLKAGKRQEHVRIFWLGDSHTAADFLSDTVRDALWKENAEGGPGFVRVGLRPYRHGRARVDVVGKWQRVPYQPSRRSPSHDGVFGLAGIRTVPDLGASATVSLYRSKLQGPVRWQLLYRLPAGARLRVRLGDADVVIDEKTESEAVEGSSIRRLVLEGSPEDELKVFHVAGSPELFGAYVESASTPGVVLDTAGIDGARVATALAWNAEAWQAELRDRSPDLLVIAYGTNEAFDRGAPEKYGPELEELVGRARTAVPGLPCFILGPPDSASRSGGSEPRVWEITRVQEAAAAKLGCQFVSLARSMGGEGSFETWMQEEPPLARRDRIHFTVDGYERQGELLSPAFTSPAPPARYEGPGRP